jgi:hypothetical protein
MNKSVYKTFAALALLTTLPAVAHAQAQSPRAACRADFNKFCATVAPGGGRIAACLKEKADKLSPECKDALKSAKAE